MNTITELSILKLTLNNKVDIIDKQIQNIIKKYITQFNISLNKDNFNTIIKDGYSVIEYKIDKTLLYDINFKKNENGILTYQNYNDNKNIYITINKFNIPILEKYKLNYIYLDKHHDNFKELFKKLINKGNKIIFIDILNYKYEFEYGILKQNIQKEFINDDNYKDIFYNIEEYNITKEFELSSYEDTLKTGLEELKNTNKNDVFSWGYDDLDKKIGYIKKGELILVGGTTGTGKSTFVNNIAKKIGNTGNKVLKFTLEDRLEDKKKQEYLVELNRILNKRENRFINYNDFISNNFSVKEEIKQEAINNLIEQNKHILEVKRNKEDKINIDELENIVKEGINKGCNIVIIDHLQEFNVDGNKERHDLKIEEVMYKIKNITRKYNILIFLIAHFKKIDGKPSENSFKDSIAISQVANKVLLLYRDKLSPNSETELIITKNREKGNGTGTVYMNFDFDTLTYTDIKINKSDLEKNNFNDIIF